MNVPGQNTEISIITHRKCSMVHGLMLARIVPLKGNQLFIAGLLADLEEDAH